MKWHIAVQVGGAAPAVHAEPTERTLQITMDAPGAPAALHENVWDLLTRNQLVASPPAVADLFRLAAAVFAADLRISRRADPQSDGWTRDLALHLPVVERERWEAARPIVQNLLRFLTGDVWHVAFGDAPFARPPARQLRNTKPPLDATAVCLLSGGLDSFIGASDALADGERLYLVSVGSMGSAAHSTPAQARVAAALHAQYGPDAPRYLPFRVSPPPKEHRRQMEDTQRSRSMLFLALGVLTAATAGQGIPLIVPENGFITLNVPLAESRLGTLSTRTTHPETIRLLRELLEQLGVDVPLRLPYRHATKGQMLDRAADRQWVIGAASRTVSCAHPTADRFAGGPIERYHCGHCVPCIIRRAALHHVGADNPREYRRNLLTEALDPRSNRGADVRAARIAALRDPTTVGVANLLHSGPLPVDAAEIQGYLGVYRAGLNELREFFNPT